MRAHRGVEMSTSDAQDVHPFFSMMAGLFVPQSSR